MDWLIITVGVLCFVIVGALCVACFTFGSERGYMRASAEHRRQRAARHNMHPSDAAKNVLYESGDGEVILYYLEGAGVIRLTVTKPGESPSSRTLHYAELRDMRQGIERFMDVGKVMPIDAGDIIPAKPRRERGERNDFPPWKPN